MARARRAENRRGDFGSEPYVTTPVVYVRPSFGNARRVARRNQWILVLLVVMECCFALAFLLVKAWEGASLGADAAANVWFNLDGEGTVPALFSAVQFLALAAVWFSITPLAACKLPRRFFLLVGAVFLFLAADEWFQLHEHVRTLLRALNVQMVTHSLYRIGPWLPLYLAAGVVFVLVTGSFWYRLWHAAREPAYWMLTGAVLFLFGGVVLEISSYKQFHLYPTHILYASEVTLEEFFEMAGASVVLFGALELKRVWSAGG